ncbi:hypothetical protein ACVNF4_31615, partial [Streptomyces sp. S6]
RRRIPSYTPGPYSPALPSPRSPAPIPPTAPCLPLDRGRAPASEAARPHRYQPRSDRRVTASRKIGAAARCAPVPKGTASGSRNPRDA